MPIDENKFQQIRRSKYTHKKVSKCDKKNLCQIGKK